MHHTKRYRTSITWGGRNASRCTRAPLFVALVLLASLAILAAFAVQDGSDEVSGANYTDERNVNYVTIDGNNAKVVPSSGARGDITIPSKITILNTEYTVTVVDHRAFYDNSGITSVTLPKTVTSIGDFAFSRCAQLATVNMPKVTSIGENAFAFSSNLASADMPEVTQIGDGAFAYCYNLASADMPKVKSIGEKAFWTCIYLSFLRFGPLETMADDAFHATDFSFKDRDGNDVPVGVGLKDKAWKRLPDSFDFIEAYKLGPGPEPEDPDNNWILITAAVGIVAVLAVVGIVVFRAR